jgi:hypothetical protein
MSDDSKQADQPQVAATQKKATRGVSYPFIGLEEAVEKARMFHREERKSSAPVASAMRHFGYAESSGVGRQTVSALLQFGLLEDEGRKEDRHVKLTDNALTIVLDLPDSPSRISALQQCVRTPRLYTAILSKWPDDLPSDHTLGFYLQKEFDFNPKTLHDFISNFRSSLAYAKIASATKLEPLKTEEEKTQTQQNPEVGDLIQWESGGVLRLEKPRRVRAKHEHDGSWWIFVEGSETGIPMEEAVIVERAQQEQKRERAAPTLAIFTPSEEKVSQPSPSEREWLRGPLSKEVNYRLIVSGELGSKEIGKLIKLLEAQKLVLDDDE